MSDILSAAKKGVSHGVALGADQIEVYVVKQQLTRISVRKAHVIGGDVVEMGGAGVRVYMGGALGVAATSRLDEVKRAVERAYQLAKGTIGDPEFKSLPGPSDYDIVEGLYDEELANAPFEELTEGFMEGVTAASGDGELTVSGGLTRSMGEVAVVNSLGVECQIRGTFIGGSIGTKAERG
jgi:predicted Zn-dependent protease